MIPLEIHNQQSSKNLQLGASSLGESLEANIRQIDLSLKIRPFDISKEFLPPFRKKQNKTPYEPSFKYIKNI
jgi:hypothetical protein